MAESDSCHLLIYDYVADILQRRGPYREAHLAKIRAEREAGRLGLAGALGDPPSGGALQFIGVDRAQIESYAQSDPYVVAGLVTSWRILPWKLV